MSGYQKRGKNEDEGRTIGYSTGGEMLDVVQANLRSEDEEEDDEEEDGRDEDGRSGTGSRHATSERMKPEKIGSSVQAR